MPRVSNIIQGQRVDPVKLSQAKVFRRRMTTAERALWNALRNDSLGGLHFRRQQVIAGFIADFYCHAAALAVEVDGPVHRPQSEYDVARDHALSELGIRVMRLSNDDVINDLAGALRRIERKARDLTPFPFPKGKGNLRRE